MIDYRLGFYSRKVIKTHWPFVVFVCMLLIHELLLLKVELIQIIEFSFLIYFITLFKGIIQKKLNSNFCIFLFLLSLLRLLLGLLGLEDDAGTNQSGLCKVFPIAILDEGVSKFLEWSTTARVSNLDLLKHLCRLPPSPDLSRREDEALLVRRGAHAHRLPLNQA